MLTLNVAIAAEMMTVNQAPFSLQIVLQLATAYAGSVAAHVL